jgi:uncharacterized membrane protein YfcA
MVQKMLLVIALLAASSLASAVRADMSSSSAGAVMTDAAAAAVMPPLPNVAPREENAKQPNTPNWHSKYLLSAWQRHAMAPAPGTALPPFQWDTRNVLALVISFVVAALAASAGVGGGAFFTPLAIVCLSFSKSAT